MKVTRILFVLFLSFFHSFFFVLLMNERERETALLFSLPLLLRLSFILPHLLFGDSTAPFHLIHYAKEVTQKVEVGFLSLRNK